MAIDFLTLDDVIRIYEDQIERYGGQAGIRDTNALLSAVAMPQAAFDGKHLHTDLFEMAAAYLLFSQSSCLPCLHSLRFFFSHASAQAVSSSSLSSAFTTVLWWGVGLRRVFSAISFGVVKNTPLVIRSLSTGTSF